MKRFRSNLKEDVYSLYSMNIPADLSESELKPYFEELNKVIVIESREKNLIVKVKVNDEVEL
jgi:TPP-dependent indolepyruvate ferredoxin oxidoreductase alpha subunit